MIPLTGARRTGRGSAHGEVKLLATALVRSLLDRPETRFAGGGLADLFDQHALNSPGQIVDWLQAMFLAGTQVNAGFVGPHPSLTDLDAGDLRFHTDFRQVYAAILDDWLGCPSGPVLGGEYPPAHAIRG